MMIKKANNFIFFLIRCVLKPLLIIRYGLKFFRKTSKGIKRPCIIIANHQTIQDQFIVGVSFKFGINFIASDSIFRNGIGSKLMQWIARPIPITKGTSDPTTVKNIMSIIKDGGAVALFPEGNRTFYGETSTFKPTIGKLAKKLRVPLVIVKMQGGFNTAPRWKAKVSKGKMTVGVTRVLQPEEMDALTDEEINGIIGKELYFNEFEYNKEAKIKYRGKRKAQYLETVLFGCPECGSFEHLHSYGNDFFCNKCGARVTINKYGFFDKLNNAEKLPDTILEWSKIQLEQIKTFDYSDYSDKPVFSDKNIRIFQYERAGSQTLITSGELKFFKDRITVGDKEILISDINDMSVQSVSKFQLYLKNGEMLMILSDVKAAKKVNLMKYMICAYHIKHMTNNDGGDYYGY